LRDKPISYLLPKLLNAINNLSCQTFIKHRLLGVHIK